MQPVRQLGSALIRGVVGVSVGPFAQRGLDEAFSLAVGLGRIGPGADVLEGVTATGVAEGEGFVAGAVVGHDALDANAEAGIVSKGSQQEGDGAVFRLVGPDLGEGDARGIVDRDVDELPADTAAVALAGAIASDAVADPFEAAKLLDVDVEELAGFLAFVASYRFSWREVLE